MFFPHPHTTARRWACFACLVVGVFVLGLSAEADGDIWWHLAAGREMVKTRSWLVTDPFSVSAGGRPWVDVHWLFQLAAYAVHRVGGLFGLVLWKSAVVSAAAGVLFVTVLRSSARRALDFFAIALLSWLFLAREQLQLRPLIFTLLFLAVFLLELEEHRRRASLRILWTLPAVQLVWANVQGLYVLGLAVVGAYAVGALLCARFGAHRLYPFAREAVDRARCNTASRTLLWLLALTLVASLLSPFGIQTLRLPSLLFARLLPESGNVFSANIAENVPPFSALGLESGRYWHLQCFLGFLCLALVAPGARLRLSHALVLGGFAILALLANRNIILLYWVGTPLAALTASPALARVARRLQRLQLRGAVAASSSVAMALLVSLSVSAAVREPSLAMPAPFRVPETSSRIIASVGGQGDIFAADAFGGYLIWQLYPEHRPYLDTRLVLRTAAEYREYLRVVDEPSRFDQFQRIHRFAYVVLPSAYPDRYLGLIAHLYQSPDWKLVYTDGSETLFAAHAVAKTGSLDLGTSGTVEQILAALSDKYSRSPRLAEAARVQLATLLMSLAEFAQAERALSGLQSHAALALRARCRLALGDAAKAREISAALLARRQDHLESLNLLSALSLEHGQSRDAMEFLRRAIAAAPRDPEAQRILSSMEDQHHGK